MGKGDGLHCTGSKTPTKRRGQRRAELAKEDYEANAQAKREASKALRNLDPLNKEDYRIEPLPVFNEDFFDQPFSEQVLEVEAALDAVGLGIESVGPPPPGKIGQRFLDQGNENPPIDLRTGQRIIVEDTEQANALWVTYDSEGYVDDVGYKIERRQLHMEIIGRALVGHEEREEEAGWDSLEAWAKAQGISLEEAERRGARHFGKTVSWPLLDQDGNPVYKNGIGSLLGAKHPITEKLLIKGAMSLTPEDKEEIRQAASSARGGQEPTALFMMGGMGAGKTSGLNQRPDLQPEHAVILGPDDIKSEIPEFQEMLAARESGAASLVHRESSRITAELKSLAVETGLNLVMDGTGNWNVESFGQELDGVIHEGYRANLLAVDIPTDLALVRAVERASKTGRWAQEPIIRRTHGSVAENISVYLSDARFEQTILFDNSGQEAVEIARASKGKVTVKSQELLDRVFAKKDESTTREVVSPRPGKIPVKIFTPMTPPDKWIQYPLSDWTKYLGEKPPSYWEDRDFNEQMEEMMEKYGKKSE